LKAAKSIYIYYNACLWQR